MCRFHQFSKERSVIFLKYWSGVSFSQTLREVCVIYVIEEYTIYFYIFYKILFTPSIFEIACKSAT